MKLLLNPQQGEIIAERQQLTQIVAQAQQQSMGHKHHHLWLRLF